MNELNYNRFIADLLALNPNDVVGLQRLSQLLADLSNPSTVQLLNNIRDLEMLFMNINALDDNVIVPPDTMTHRRRFLRRLERLSKCEGATIAPKSLVFPSPVPEPFFSRFDIIHCQFGGVGWEYDGPHYAMVWEDKHFELEITVIPSTSQFNGESVTDFSVGYIGGLPAGKRTILSIPKLIKISRKRVDLNSVRGTYVYGSIPLGQLAWIEQRVNWALAFWLYKERSLHYYIRNETQECLPVNFLTGYDAIRFSPVRDVQWERSTFQLHYRLWNEPVMRILQMKQPRAFVKKSYKMVEIYDRFFSENPTDPCHYGI